MLKSTSACSQVLVSTATLAWGVNLPAHMVIIKGTQVSGLQFCTLPPWHLLSAACTACSCGYEPVLQGSRGQQVTGAYRLIRVPRSALLHSSDALPLQEIRRSLVRQTCRCTTLRRAPGRSWAPWT